MQELITEKELPEINRILAAGNDCRIQVTKDGWRILSDRVTVVKKRSVTVPCRARPGKAEEAPLPA